jgi:hypothetical protein
MHRADAAWLAFWAAFGVGDYIADRYGYSLCTSGRRLARLHTPTGRVAFRVGYACGVVVLYRHLMKRT